MQVKKVEMLKRETILLDKYQYPATFFELTDSEQALYDDFRTKHRALENMINSSQSKMIDTEERNNGEKKISEMFLELINPYLSEQGLEAISSFTCYGQDTITRVDLPRYSLFKNSIPFDSSIKIIYEFSTKDENLFCTSSFNHTNSKDYPKRSGPEIETVYRLLNEITKNREQDGINFPIMSFRGNLIDFASTDFSSSLILFLKEILEQIDPESMKQLNILKDELSKYKRIDELSSKMSIQQEVFKKAYDKKFEEILALATGYNIMSQVHALIKD